MDVCAELTLQVIRFVQQPIDAPCSPLEWVFIPEGRRASWADARRLLSEAPKPFIVAPISEPGMIGSWGVRALQGEHLARVEHNLRNQQRWLEEAVNHHHWAETDQVLFESPGDELELSLSDLRRWLVEYAVIAGWTISEGPDAARPGRLVIRKANGVWSPGMVACNREHH